jgi:hypothetical protein
MNVVNWFEIPAKDLARAKAFYETVFGVSLSPMDMGPSQMQMFPMEQGAGGSAGALITSEGYTPSHQGTMVYFSVEDIEATLGKAGARGGKTLVPKMSIGEFGFIAHLEDTEGNRLGIHSMQ